MHKPGHFILLLVVILMFSFSCRRSQYDVNTSGISIDIGIKRLEVDLFSESPAMLSSSLPVLKEKYSGFIALFGYVINAGELTDSLWDSNVISFCTDKLNFEVYNEVMKVFPDIRWLESGLSDAFAHYAFHFPDMTVPGVYTCTTGFNNSIIVGDSVLGIGLDRYLGAGSDYYPKLGIYNYQAAKMTPDNIITDCMYAWAASEWDYESCGYSAENLLSHIIHEGKLLYFARSMLPGTGEERVFGFTDAQMDFCRNNEGSMWQYLVEKDLLFSSDNLMIRKLTGEAPFTSIFTPESPGRAAVWIGFRIVERFMAGNRSVTLGELMKIKDPGIILERARYAPD